MSGIFEIAVVVAIILLLFGAKRLPAVGSALGKMVRNFRAGKVNRDEIEVTSHDQEELDRHSKDS